MFENVKKGSWLQDINFESVSKSGYACIDTSAAQDVVSCIYQDYFA